MPRNPITLAGRRFDLAKCAFAGIVRDRLPWFGSQFRKDLRKPSLDKAEWDFRFIEDIESARAAAVYEYAREVKWMYEYHAEWLALLLFKGGKLDRKATKDFKRRWDPRNEGWTPDPFLLFPGYDWMESVFPIPLAEVPRGCREIGKTMKSDGVSVYTLSVDKYNSQDATNAVKACRAHAIAIDWSLSNKKIARALAC